MSWLKEIRKNAGLTQRKTAEVAGVSRFYYIDIELGRREPNVKSAKKIAAVLGFDWTRFYEEQ